MKEAVQALVDQFKTGINNLVLKQINESLSDLGKPVRLPRGMTAKVNGNGHAKATRQRAGASRSYGEKRTPEEIEAIGLKFLGFVTDNHGQRIETISAAINVPTSELQTPLKKLIAAGEIKTFGERRATRYFPKGVRPTKALVDQIKGASAPAADTVE